jgi:hypothetical protein
MFTRLFMLKIIFLLTFIFQNTSFASNFPPPPYHLAITNLSRQSDLRTVVSAHQIGPTCHNKSSIIFSTLPDELKTIALTYAVHAWHEEKTAIFLEALEYWGHKILRKSTPHNDRFWSFFAYKLNRIIDRNPHLLQDTHVVKRLGYCASTIMMISNPATIGSTIDLFFNNDPKNLRIIKEFFRCVCFLKEYPLHEKKKRHVFCVEFLKQYPPRLTTLFIEIIQTFSGNRRIDLSNNWLNYLKEYFDDLDKSKKLTPLWAHQVRNIIWQLLNNDIMFNDAIVKIARLSPGTPFCGVKSSLHFTQNDVQEKSKHQLPTNPFSINFFLDLERFVQNLCTDSESERGKASLTTFSLEADEEDKRDEFHIIENEVRQTILNDIIRDRKEIAKQKKEATHLANKQKREAARTLFTLMEVEENIRQERESDAQGFFDDLFQEFSCSSHKIQLIRMYKDSLNKKEDEGRRILIEEHARRSRWMLEQNEWKTRDLIDDEYLRGMGLIASLKFIEENSEDSIIKEYRELAAETLQDFINRLTLERTRLYNNLFRALTDDKENKGRILREEKEEAYAKMMSQRIQFIEECLVRTFIAKAAYPQAISRLLINPLLGDLQKAYRGYYLYYLQEQSKKLTLFEQVNQGTDIIENFPSHSRNKITDIFNLGGLAKDNPYTQKLKKSHVTEVTETAVVNFYTERINEFKEKYTNHLSLFCQVYWNHYYITKAIARIEELQQAGIAGKESEKALQNMAEIKKQEYRRLDENGLERLFILLKQENQKK